MLRVPGIGTMNGFCASNQARAIWAGVAFFTFAHRVRRSTNGWLARRFSGVQRGKVAACRWWRRIGCRG